MRQATYDFLLCKSESAALDFVSKWLHLFANRFIAQFGHANHTPQRMHLRLKWQLMDGRDSKFGSWRWRSDTILTTMWWNGTAEVCLVMRRQIPWRRWRAVFMTFTRVAFTLVSFGIRRTWNTSGMDGTERQTANQSNSTCNFQESWC